VANNNFPQITSVTSEALQAQIRNLLPSQEGFGTDLMAQNVIVPVVDLTSAAEGSQVPAYLTNAIAFGSQSAFDITAGTVVLVNTPGFYRVFGVSTLVNDGAGNRRSAFSMSDGFSSKEVWAHEAENAANQPCTAVPFDFNVFLAAGESISGFVQSGASVLRGSTRQIADNNGNLVNPSGFNPQ
jgi:hypothetical protein